MCEIVDIDEETVERLREEQRHEDRQLEKETMAEIVRDLMKYTDAGRKG